MPTCLAIWLGRQLMMHFGSFMELLGQDGMVEMDGSYPLNCYSHLSTCGAKNTSFEMEIHPNLGLKIWRTKFSFNIIDKVYILNHNLYSISCPNFSLKYQHCSGIMYGKETSNT